MRTPGKAKPLGDEPGVARRLPLRATESVRIEVTPDSRIATRAATCSIPSVRVVPDGSGKERAAGAERSDPPSDNSMAPRRRKPVGTDVGRSCDGRFFTVTVVGAESAPAGIWISAPPSPATVPPAVPTMLAAAEALNRIMEVFTVPSRNSCRVICRLGEQLKSSMD